MSAGAIPFPLEPVTLEGRLVRLEPLSRDHLDGLAAVAFDPALWRWTLAGAVDRERLEAWLDTAVANQAAGSELPFATIERASGRPIGSSRYLSIVPEHRRLEIGWTWVARAWQRSGVNREAKLLMLEHAFERIGCQRVEFKTNALNEQSRAALLGIGASFEGIFRKHMLGRDGEVRDSAYFSITDDEWPAVKARLAASVEAAVAART
ncbi:MAG TPA: GNAT family N-acetyltransferase [Candidatus Limnocylindrales bacterium]|jgi:RimJ/RimL family protein N-acetyltransferase|nr:GNAT family N-acetyltransferase [Candidatus Limnocylindrales bacterium]